MLLCGWKAGRAHNLLAQDCVGQPKKSAGQPKKSAISRKIETTMCAVGCFGNSYTALTPCPLAALSAPRSGDANRSSPATKRPRTAGAPPPTMSDVGLLDGLVGACNEKGFVLA